MAKLRGSMNRKSERFRIADHIRICTVGQQQIHTLMVIFLSCNEEGCGHAIHLNVHICTYSQKNQKWILAHKWQRIRLQNVKEFFPSTFYLENLGKAVKSYYFVIFLYNLKKKQFTYLKRASSEYHTKLKIHRQRNYSPKYEVICNIQAALIFFCC